MAATMGSKSCLLLQSFATFLVVFMSAICFKPSICQPEDLSLPRILSEVERRCVLVLYNKNIAHVETLANELHQILTDSKDITFGTSELILSDGLTWPNGQPLQWVGKSSKAKHLISEADGGTLVIFPKQKKDRECLITGPGRKPQAELFTGPLNVQTALDWVNNICHTYISPTGGLTYEGLHRDSILQNLFSVSHVSNFTMQDFNRQWNQGSLVSRLQLQNVSGESASTVCQPLDFRSLIFDGECSKDMKGFCRASEAEIADGDMLKPAFSQFGNTEMLKDISEDCPEGIRKDPISSRRFPQCERLSELPTKGQFFYDYLKTSKPVILEGAAAHWDAFRKWTMEFLRDQYGDKDVHVKLAPDGLFEGVEASSNWEEYGTFTIPSAVLDILPFPDLVVVRPATINLKFAEFLDMISNTSKVEKESGNGKPRASAYLEYSSIPNYLPELEQDIQELPFARDLLKRRHLNIWLSDGNTLGKLHFDPFDNFLCQIRGKKQLTLFEPHDNTKMYEAHIPEAKLGYDPLSRRFRRKKLLDSTAMVMAPVDILNPDFQRFPAFAETRPLNCTINEGDVLFMPAFWWHEVQSYPNVTEGRNLAVNFWYEPFLTKEFPCGHCKLDVNPLYRHLL
ncbi:bifunctional peptidase and arginyl-hydroxylase JMJD5-like [Patiria miniata]|uniref:JmjC domain-containing protein n=1 Tax=Patiria miniata TaxID=46514 RepID=A0A913ZLF0_PATMI|nr:bifunctional peptidase and arginyl-hydroxylase JMJD5-like [Patiria miniata]